MSPFTKVYNNSSGSGATGQRQSNSTANSSKQRSGQIRTGAGMGRGVITTGKQRTISGS